MVTWLGLSAFFPTGLSHFSIEADIQIEQVRGKQKDEYDVMDYTNHIGNRFRIFGMDEDHSYRVVKKTWAWVNDVPQSLVVLIGIAELLGALGLILPWALNITPVLTPITAIALAMVTLLGMLFHISRKEYREIGVNIFFIVLALIIAFGRL